MKRKFMLFSAAMIVCSTMFAQSFKFYKVEKSEENGAIVKADELENGAEITVNAFVAQYGQVYVESDLGLKNITTNNITTTGSQTVLTVPKNSTLQFCYATCQMTNGNTSQEGTVNAGEFLNGFHMALSVKEGVDDKAKVLYKVVNKSNPSDAATVTVNYVYSPNGITSNTYNKNVNVYQNGDVATLAYSFETDATRQVKLFDVTGQAVGSEIISNTNGSLSLPSLDKGLYIYTVVEGGKTIATCKFMIK